MGDLFLSEDMRMLLRNKSICIIGDSVQRTIYKDFITLLQENRFSSGDYLGEFTLVLYGTIQIRR